MVAYVSISMVSPFACTWLILVIQIHYDSLKYLDVSGTISAHSLSFAGK